MIIDCWKHDIINIMPIYYKRVCQNAKSNENSSSKIEEVPEGRRSMIV